MDAIVKNQSLVLTLDTSEPGLSSIFVDIYNLVQII